MQTDPHEGLRAVYVGMNFISTYHFLGMVESSLRTDKKNFKKTYRRNSVNTLIMADVKKKKKSTWK